MIGSQGYLTVWRVLWVPSVLAKDSIIEIFCKWINSEIRQQDGLSKCPIDKMIGSQGYLNVWTVPRVPSVRAKNSFTQNFFEIKKFSIKHCRKFRCRLSKIRRLHYETVIYHRLTVFHQLFRYTSVGPSKSPIDKMIGLEGYLTVWKVLWVTSALEKNSIIEIFCQISKWWT